MMTLIAKRKRAFRGETEVRVQHRSLIVEVRPYTVFVRQKGRRIGYEVDWESIFCLAVKKFAAKVRADKLQRKGIYRDCN